MTHNKKKKIYIQWIHILFVLLLFFPSMPVYAVSKDQTPEMTYAPFFIVATLIGGTIIVTLTYVSWKKYQGERKKKNENNNS